MSTPALTPARAAEQFAALVGEQNTRLEPKQLVVLPGDVDQLSRVLKYCHEQELVVMPTGGGTKLAWGNQVTAGVRLDLSRMNAIREHAWQDMTCSVEGGCTWAALQALLEGHGQMVALDPLWPEHATVGGVVATNDSGALRLRYGGLRDLIIGMTVVLADGTVAKTGGKVVKNVAGYDLHKLMTGSFGTLGVIASVNFRLHPVESHRRTWTARAKDPVELRDALAALLDSQLAPSAAQLRAGKDGCALDVCLAAPEECDATNEAQLQTIFGKLELLNGSEEVWKARERVLSPESMLVKVTVLPARLCEITTAIYQDAIQNGLPATIVAQATGVMSVAVDSPDQRAVPWLERLRKRAEEWCGSAVVHALPETLRGQIDPWGTEPSAICLMRVIKQRFDPKAILNRGRFVGGI